MLYFSNLAELWNMEGHGIYVWAAYLVFFVLVTALTVMPVVQYRKSLRQLQFQQQAEQMTANEEQAG